MPRTMAALRQAVTSATRVDRSKIAVDVGFRVALGVGVCLVVGRLTGHTVAGVTATIGAINGGMASHQGTYRSRAAIVLAAAAAAGVCAAIGAVVGHLLGVDALVTAVIAFFAALLVALGPAGSVVGIQAVVGLVVFSQFHFPWPVAVRDGGLVLLGGAVQATLVVLVWPLRRFPAERRALSEAYSALSRFSRRAGADPAALLEPAAMDGLERIWSDPQPFGGDEIAAHRLLAAQADRLRMEIVAVLRARSRLEAARQEHAARSLDQVLERTAAVLEEVAAAVRDGRAPAGWEGDRLGFRSAAAGLHQADPQPADPRPGDPQPADPRPADPRQAGRSGLQEDAAVADAVRRVDALAGQLRAVLRTAAVPAGVSTRDLDLSMAGDPATTPVPRRRGTDWGRERLATLRSNLTLSSQACRHAARMSVTLAAAVAVSHAFPYGHRYWLPMTAMLVLRPDFASTVTRGVSRVAGTLVGAGLVTLALAELRPGPDWLIALVILLCFPAAALVLANYAIFSVCIASLVVTLLAFTGNPEVATAGQRSIYTLLGSVVAFAAYLLWPTWEATSLPETLASLAGTEGRYAGRVLRAWAAPDDADREALQRSRLEARVARSNAEAAVTRWLGEPPEGGPLSQERVLGYMAGVRSCVQSLLALHADLPAEGPGEPAVAALADQVERALAAIAEGVKGSTPAAPFPDLRKEQLALAGRVTAGGGGAVKDPAPGVVLVGETDVLVDSLDALGHLLGIGGVTEGT